LDESLAEPMARQLIIARYPEPLMPSTPGMLLINLMTPGIPLGMYAQSATGILTPSMEPSVMEMTLIMSGSYLMSYCAVSRPATSLMFTWKENLSPFSMPSGTSIHTEIEGSAGAGVGVVITIDVGTGVGEGCGDSGNKSGHKERSNTAKRIASNSPPGMPHDHHFEKLPMDICIKMKRRVSHYRPFN